MSERTELDGIAVGSVWRRNPPGREVVRVERVWIYGQPDDEGPTVRAHPVNGGRPLVAPTEWLREHYTRVTPPEEPCRCIAAGRGGVHYPSDPAAPVKPRTQQGGSEGDE